MNSLFTWLFTLSILGICFSSTFGNSLDLNQVEMDKYSLQSLVTKVPNSKETIRSRRSLSDHCGPAPLEKLANALSILSGGKWKFKIF